VLSSLLKLARCLLSGDASDSPGETSMKRSLLCLGILLLSSAASSARDPRDDGHDTNAPALGRACGHVPELEAARRALAEGDRERALSHLRRARALVAACERDAEDAGRGGESAASAFAMAPAAEPDLEPTGPARTKPHRGSYRSPPRSRFDQPGAA